MNNGQRSIGIARSADRNRLDLTKAITALEQSEPSSQAHYAALSQLRIMADAHKQHVAGADELGHRADALVKAAEALLRSLQGTWFAGRERRALQAAIDAYCRR
jgi:hypothetical protein